MPYVKCPRCGGELFEQEVRCPFCSKRIRYGRGEKAACLIVALVIVLAALTLVCQAVCRKSSNLDRVAEQQAPAGGVVQRDNVYCSKASASVRARPANNAPIIGKMHFNEMHMAVDSKPTLVGNEQWYCIEWGDSVGWVRSTVIEFYEIEPDGLRDLEVIADSWSMSEYGSMATWSIRVRNNSPAYCYKDPVFKARYIGESGTVIYESLLGHTEYVFLRPGQVRRLEWDDVMAPSQSARAGVALVKAEPTACP